MHADLMIRPAERYRLLAILLAVTLLDQLSKLVARAWLNPEQPLPLIPGVFQLTLAQNTGAAFSMLRHEPGLLTVVAGVIFLLLLAYAFSRREFIRFELPAIALILGGALGNLLDRFLYGQVTDFLDVVAIHYPIFNLADTAICYGVALMLVAHFRSARARA